MENGQPPNNSSNKTIKLNTARKVTGETDDTEPAARHQPHHHRHHMPHQHHHYHYNQHDHQHHPPIAISPSNNTPVSGQVDTGLVCAEGGSMDVSFRTQATEGITTSESWMSPPANASPLLPAGNGTVAPPASTASPRGGRGRGRATVRGGRGSRGTRGRGGRGSARGTPPPVPPRGGGGGGGGAAAPAPPVASKSSKLPAGGRCFKCCGFGHKAKDCPNEELSNDQRPCFNCHEIGHLAKDCPHADNKKCLFCHEVGHIAKNCPKKKKRSPNKKHHLQRSGTDQSSSSSSKSSGRHRRHRRTTNDNDNDSGSGSSRSSNTNKSKGSSPDKDSSTSSSSNKSSTRSNKQ